MASETRAVALRLVRALYAATDALPQQWRMLEELEAPTMDAIMYTMTRGWVIIDAGLSICSICLTEAGRRRVK